jgi:hypothetical protein
MMIIGALAFLIASLFAVSYLLNNGGEKKSVVNSVDTNSGSSLFQRDAYSTTPSTSVVGDKFSASWTNSARVRYKETPAVRACGGDQIKATNLECSGDQYIRLFRGGTEVSSNDGELSLSSSSSSSSSAAASLTLCLPPRL